MEPRMITLIRYILLSALLLLSFVVLGLSGNLINGDSANNLLIPDFLGLDLAVAVITLVIVNVSVAIDFFRRGAFTSMVATELGWSGFLMVLWIAAAGDTTAVRAGLSCNIITTDFAGDILNDGPAQVGCHEAQAIIAFSWLSFFILLAWFVTLLSLAITAHGRGNVSVWTAPVNGTDFFTRKAMGGQPQSQMGYGGVPQQQYTGGPIQQQYAGGPMQQQYTGQAQSYPPAGYNTTPVGAQV